MVEAAENKPKHQPRIDRMIAALSRELAAYNVRQEDLGRAVRAVITVMPAPISRRNRKEAERQELQATLDRENDDRRYVLHRRPKQKVDNRIRDLMIFEMRGIGTSFQEIRQRFKISDSRTRTIASRVQRELMRPSNYQRLRAENIPDLLTLATFIRVEIEWQLHNSDERVLRTSSISSCALSARLRNYSMDDG